MKRRRGFTLVELMVVISVIAILAGVVVFAFGSWRSSTAKTEVKNDLTSAVAKVKDYRNWKNGYPADQTAFNTAYQVSGQLTMTYTLRAGGASYCLQANSTAVPTVQYYIDSNVGTTPTAGTTTCS